MLSKIVKSTLALRGMTLKDLAATIGEPYNSVYDVVHEKWGKKRGEVAPRILKKLSRFLDIDLEKAPELNINLFDDILHRKDSEKKRRR